MKRRYGKRKRERFSLGVRAPNPNTMYWRCPVHGHIPTVDLAQCAVCGHWDCRHCGRTRRRYGLMPIWRCGTCAAANYPLPEPPWGWVLPNPAQIAAAKEAVTNE